jgi:hypothetical protein
MGWQLVRLALAIEFPATFARTTRNFLMFRLVDWRPTKASPITASKWRSIKD